MTPFVREKSWPWLAVAVALAIGNDLQAERHPTTADGAKPQADDIDEQVVILQDGGVMRGRVSRDGDRYVLARATGETFIPAGNVLLVADSLEDAYQQRRQRLAQPTAADHLVLTEWCLRHDLLAHAEVELAAARAIEPHHGKLALIERRLDLAIERQKHAKAAPVPVAESRPVSLPTNPEQTAVGKLPPGALELFTRKVQPVLVNSCTTSGCHELGGREKFQLDRAILRGMSNRRTTMNNLAATLALVDREQPRLSPLLTVPRRTHGNLKEPVFGPRREAAFRHLYEWVELVTADTAKPATAPPQEPQDANASETGGPPSPETASATGATPTLRYGAQLERWLPRDEFDPEIFNRKYAAQADNTAEAGATNPSSSAEP